MTLDDVLLHVDPPVVVLHCAEGQPHWALADIKAAALVNPGDYRLALCIGRHTLALGDRWNVEPSRELAAALEDFGRVEVIDASDAEGNGAPSRRVPQPRPRRRR